MDMLVTLIQIWIKFKQMRSDLETKAAATEKTTAQQRADVQRATAK